MKPLLIIGIDPGTTVGYAVLDIEGNILALESKKELGLNELISKIISFGKPVAVGCDVTPAPNFVEKFSVKFGCRLIEPDRDLLVKEKEVLVKGFKEKYKNSHQRDSLASALYAFEILAPIVSKAVRRLKKYRKPELLYDVINLVLSKDISIQAAVDIIEKPDKEETRIVKKAVEQKTLMREDFLKLYEKVSSLQNELDLLRKHNAKLARESEETVKKDKFLLKKLDKFIPKEKVSELLVNKDKLIANLNIQIEGKLKLIDEYEKEIDKLVSFIVEIKKNFVLKRLENLGSKEYDLKKNILKIKNKDILFVDDLDISSKKVIDELKDKIDIIVYKKAGKKTLNSLPFVAINADSLNPIEETFFALVNRKAFKKAKSQSDILGKIVEEYKKGRS